MMGGSFGTEMKTIVQLVTYINGGFYGDGKEYVSHGIDPETGSVITMPNESLESIGAKWDSDHGYHLVYEDE